MGLHRQRPRSKPRGQADSKSQRRNFEGVFRIQAFERRCDGAGWARLHPATRRALADRQRFRSHPSPIVGRRFFGFCHRSIHVCSHRPSHLHAPPRFASNEIRDRRKKMMIDPFANELVAGSEPENAVGQTVELNSGKPLVEASGRTNAGECDRFVPQDVLLVLAVCRVCHVVRPRSFVLPSLKKKRNSCRWSEGTTQTTRPPTSQFIHNLWTNLRSTDLRLPSHAAEARRRCARSATKHSVWVSKA